MFNKLKQFKDLRSQAKQIQNLLGSESAEGSAEWDKIKVRISGNLEIQAVSIDTELLTADKKDKIESGVKDATNDAIKKAQRLMAEKMKNSGLTLPNL